MTLNSESNKSESNGVRTEVRTAMPQIVAVSIKNVLLLGYGMTLGFPTIVIPTLLGGQPDEPLVLDPEQISWISSINLICVPLGCIFSGIITQPIGRKKSMQLVNLPFIAAWLMFHFATRVEHLYTSLCLTGLGGGLLEAPVITYVAEITQPHLRGMLSATSSMTIIFGIFVQFLLGTFISWRTVALVNLSVPVVAIGLLFLVPESPHWLLLQGRVEDARKSLAWLRGWTSPEEISEEFSDLCRALGSGKNPPGGVDNPAFEDNNTPGVEKQDIQRPKARKVVKGFLTRSFVVPYLLICFCFFLGHFSGMTTLQTFAVQIFQALKTPIDKYYATLLLGIVELLGSLLCVLAVHYTGKRPLAFLSTIGCGTCFVIVATYAYLINVTTLTGGYEPRPTPASQNSTFPASNLSFLELEGSTPAFFQVNTSQGPLGESLNPQKELLSSSLLASDSRLQNDLSSKSGNFEGSNSTHFDVMEPQEDLDSAFQSSDHQEESSDPLVPALDKKLHRHSGSKPVNSDGSNPTPFDAVKPQEDLKSSVPALDKKFQRHSSSLESQNSPKEFPSSDDRKFQKISNQPQAISNSAFPSLDLKQGPSSSTLLPPNQQEQSPDSKLLTKESEVRKSKSLSTGSQNFDSSESLDSPDPSFNQKQGPSSSTLPPLDQQEPLPDSTLLTKGSEVQKLQSTSTKRPQHSTPLNANDPSGFSDPSKSPLLALSHQAESSLSTFTKSGKLNQDSIPSTSSAIYDPQEPPNPTFLPLSLAEEPPNSTLPVGNVQWLPTTFLIGSAFLSHTGIRLLPWVLIGEVFPAEIRSIASGLSGGMGYVFGFAANKAFLSMTQNLTVAGTFWFYGCLSLFGTVILYFYLPETEGRTLNDIEQHFAGVRKIKRGAGVYKTKKGNVERGQINYGFSEKPSNNESMESKL